jgi:acetyl esterase/lipase
MRAIVCVVALAAVLTGAGAWYLHPAVDREDGIVYGQRRGKPLVIDMIRPMQPNGIGVVLLVSGGWRSGSAGSLPAWVAAPVLRRGYTVFAVYHVSQPEATVMEIIQDMHRSVRFIRHHAEKYGIAADRIGVTGGSAGGHLSLMLATQGGPGPAGTGDPVDHETSEVQAVAIFYPVTDLLNLGKSTENAGDGGPPRSYVEAFGPGTTDLSVWNRVGRECSPIYHLTTRLPPTLIHHGDADILVPLEQSQRFCDRATRFGHEVQIVIHPGGEHGWLTMLWDVRKFAAWFDVHLLSGWKSSANSLPAKVKNN